MGPSSALQSATKREKMAVLFGMASDKRSILRFWKKDSRLTFDLWLEGLADIIYIDITITTESVCLRRYGTVNDRPATAQLFV